VILAIDPGTVQSGWCMLEHGRVVAPGSGVSPNADVLEHIRQCCNSRVAVLAIEMVASYGMPVGREVFETVRWIGRFQQAWRDPEAVRLVFRRDVKLHLCGSAKAKDANIWQALKDRLGEVGTKKNPGPLYGVSSHARAALAVAVYTHDQLKGGV
jgi:hypothetical protein